MKSHDIHTRYMSMSEERLQQACLLLAGTLPQDPAIGRRLDVAIIALSKKMEEGEFYEFIRGVSDVYNRMKAA
jgi:hypothetical protein